MKTLRSSILIVGIIATLFSCTPERLADEYQNDPTEQATGDDSNTVDETEKDENG